MIKDLKPACWLNRFCNMKTHFISLVALAFIIGCGNKSSVSETHEAANILPVEYLIAKDTTINFESGEASVPPKGFTATFTGNEQLKEWKTVNDNNNKVVAQLAKNKGDYYNLLVLDKQGYTDMTLSAKIKAVSGNEDQGGGLVWRYMDNNNYYVARYNPLENNLRFYRVVNGKRKQLESKTSNIPSGTWFILSIKMTGSKVECSLNGEKMIEASDETFTKAGLVGLWTKADAVSYFDELIISDAK
jgi:hypothetical protein